MPFDDPTRKLLAQMVGRARERLRLDVMDQLRRLGFQEDGSVLALSLISGLSAEEYSAGTDLRELLRHFVASEPPGDRERNGYDRLVREIGFTIFNRFVALRMAEERGLIIEAVSRGLASDGFQLYERVANGGMGSRVDTYRAYL